MCYNPFKRGEACLKGSLQKFMVSERDEQFHDLLERFVDVIVDTEGFTRERLVGILVEVSKFFNLSKGVTEFYENLWHEQLGKGEIFIDYDDGRESKVIISLRVVTPVLSVVKCSLYHPVDAEELSEDEYKKLNLVARGLIRFISRNRLQNSIERIAFHDFYGFPNANFFVRKYDQLNREGKLSGKILLVYNLRNFSVFNAEFGRKNGDRIMKSFYEAIKYSVGENGIVCRTSSDNFLCMFDTGFMPRIEQILKGYPIIYDEQGRNRILVSGYAGVIVLSEKITLNALEDILSVLYNALAEARMGTYGSIVYVSDKDSLEQERIKKLKVMFQEAFASGEFSAFYQPKVSIDTGKVVGAEALCRWIHDGKVMLPSEFIPVLELSNEICRLDFHVLDIVCGDIKRWLDSGLEPVRVSVNLSRKHLSNMDLVSHLLKIVDGYNIPHKYIEFEFTETTTSVGVYNLKRVVSELQEAGFSTAVDDFGIGYSSLSLIREIPWNVIKLDKDFLPLDGEASDSKTSVMYRHIASLTHDFGFETVTEGVETARQVQVLRENKCHIAQGFYFDKALPVEQFEIRLKQGYKI